jgi:hypothetical protein
MMRSFQRPGLSMLLAAAAAMATMPVTVGGALRRFQPDEPGPGTGTEPNTRQVRRAKERAAKKGAKR